MGREAQVNFKIAQTSLKIALKLGSDNITFFKILTKFLLWTAKLRSIIIIISGKV